MKTEMNKLTELGFTKTQRISLISQPFANTTVTLICDLYAEIQKIFKHYEITKIAAHPRGSENLILVLKHYGALLDHGFTHYQIIQIAGQDGGYYNILSVVNHAFEMEYNFGFSLSQIVKIVSHAGGHKNINAIQAHWKALNQFYLGLRDIVRMAAHATGSQNITALVTQGDNLQRFGFKMHQIIRILAHHRGAAKLTFIVNHLARLQAKQINPNTITKKITQNKGKKKLLEILNAETSCLPKPPKEMCDLLSAEKRDYPNCPDVISKDMFVNDTEIMQGLTSKSVTEWLTTLQRSPFTFFSPKPSPVENPPSLPLMPARRYNMLN